VNKGKKYYLLEKYLLDKFKGSILTSLQPSISSTLYAHVFRRNFSPKQNVTRHLTKEKLPKRHSYEKFMRLTLMKLTPGWNAGCILMVALAYFIRDWSNLQLAFAIASLALVTIYFLVPESPRCQFYQHFTNCLLCMKVFFAGFLYLQLAFQIFGKQCYKNLLVKCWKLISDGYLTKDGLIR
jgi:hypothetical protein